MINIFDTENNYINLIFGVVFFILGFYGIIFFYNEIKNDIRAKKYSSSSFNLKGFLGCFGLFVLGLIYLIEILLE